MVTCLDISSSGTQTYTLARRIKSEHFRSWDYFVDRHHLPAPPLPHLPTILLYLSSFYVVSFSNSFICSRFEIERGFELALWLWWVKIAFYWLVSMTIYCDEFIPNIVFVFLCTLWLLYRDQVCLLCAYSLQIKDLVTGEYVLSWHWFSIFCCNRLFRINELSLLFLFKKKKRISAKTLLYLYYMYMDIYFERFMI